MTPSPEAAGPQALTASEIEREIEEETRIFPKHIHIHFDTDCITKRDFVEETLRGRNFDPQNERALVFVHRRRDAEEMAAAYPGQADYYHAGRDSSEKEEIAARFRDSDGDVAVLFSTKAFGMGVDVRNIRYVFHAMPPASLEDYIQEIGRAGRDGKEAFAFLPYSDADFNEVRSRLVQTQLHWRMVQDTHELLRVYRDTLAETERGSFVIPDDLIRGVPSLSENLFGQGAAATRQRMLLHSLEEAGRIEVGGFEMTHWPITLGERESDDGVAIKIRRLASGRGATENVRTLISEQELRRELGLDSDAEAREQLFRAAKIGAIKIPFDVVLDWTPWAEDAKNKDHIDPTLRSGEQFFQLLRNMDGDRIRFDHKLIHPEYLSDRNAKKARREGDPVGVHFDERRQSLVRFLRRVDGLRVSGNKRTATYTVLSVDPKVKAKGSNGWRDTLIQIPERAMAIVNHLRGLDPARTIDELYRIADARLGEMRLKDLELTLHYLAALGIVRLTNDLIPTSVRILVKEAFTEPFDTPRDEEAREELHERNRLRIWRLDALQVLTRVGDSKEAFAKDFFDARSVSEARQVVLNKALEVDEGLLKQFDAVALEDYYNELTPEQQEVVRAAQTRNVIVKAGPGTGKTHTLINCVAQRLIASDKIPDGRNPNGPIPAPGILVLAYTRVVVEELRDRLRRLLTLLGRNETPQIHTFHSYALMKLGETGRHDVRMDDAIEEFTKTFEARGIPNPPAHIFVDEFQDITTGRAGMLKAIVKRGPGTLITVIGDPDQSIYDYDKGDGKKLSSDTYFASFAKRFAADERSLSVNFRSGKAILDHAKTLFARPLTPWSGATHGEAKRGSTGQPLHEHVVEAFGTARQVAVLFRSNAELYRALPLLSEVAAVEVRVLGGKGNIVHSREVNEALESLQTDHTDKPFNEELLQQVIGETRRAVWEERLLRHLEDGAWLFLQDGQHRTVADFVQWVRGDLAGNHLLYASQQRRSASLNRELILSTMHRTKGLEFESVIITPSDMRLRSEDIEEEKRLRYVAVTRAKNRLVLLNGPRETALLNDTTWAGSSGQQGRRFDSIDDEGRGAFQLFQFSRNQAYLLNDLREGDPLFIKNNALWHKDQRLCGIAQARQDLWAQQLEGIFVAEVVRADGFGEGDKFKDLYTPEVQERGWCYVVNAAGYLKQISQTTQASKP